MGSDHDAHSANRAEGDINLSPNRRKWADEQLDTRAREILEQDEKYFLRQSLSTPCLTALQAARGSAITDVQGREYLDFHGNSVHQLGHGNPEIVEAVIAQLRALPFCPRRFTNETAVALARKLTELAPAPLAKVLFAPGGAEAVGIALKLARLATGRFKTVSWWDSFHGATLDAISVGGERLFRQGLGPLVPGAIHVPPPYSFREPFRGAKALSSPEYIDYVMEREGDIAAFIAEPMRCTEVIEPPGDYWREVREICDRHGALLIFDEIPICLGRTGFMFACEKWGVAPDILCIGKGLGGGVFPMAAILARADLDIAERTALGHYTHEKSPVGAAAALAAIRYIEDNSLLERVRQLGADTLSALKVLASRHALIGDVRGAGLVLGLELVKPPGLTPASDEADRVMYACLRRGLSFKVSGGNVLTLMPPLTISDDEMDRAIQILDAALNEVEHGAPSPE